MQNAYLLWMQNIKELNELQQFLDIKYLNNQFYRRLLVRNVFSIIESYLFITRELIKLKALKHDNGDSKLTLEELSILNGKSVALTDKGEPKSTETFYNFEPSLRFTLNCFSKAFDAVRPDYGDNNFDELRRLSKRRMI
jgi:hypothetical protein